MRSKGIITNDNGPALMIDLMGSGALAHMI